MTFSDPAVRLFLPAWVPWAPWLVVAACAILLPAASTALIGVATRARWRRSPPSHWSEAARHVQPFGRALGAQQATTCLTVLIAAVCCFHPYAVGQRWMLVIFGFELARW